MFCIDLLRAIAILLITNSHLEPLYPWPILATGGMFGNELFFFISGFGLSLSLDRKRVPFGPWIGKRARRVYEPLVIATSLLLLIGFFRVRSAAALVVLYSGFQTYWFLPVIVLFYVPLYFVITRNEQTLSFGLAAAAALLAYVIAYLTVVDLTRFDVEGPVFSKAPFYFLVMLLGAYSARHQRTARPTAWDLLLLVGMMAAYVGGQFAMRAYHLFAFQFGIHLIGLVWIVAVYRCVHHPAVEKLNAGLACGIIAFLSGIALQVYLLQELFIRNQHIQALPFPLDVAVFWPTVLLAAWLLKKASFSEAKRFFSRRETGAATKR